MEDRKKIKNCNGIIEGNVLHLLSSYVIITIFSYLSDLFPALNLLFDTQGNNKHYNKAL